MCSVILNVCLELCYLQLTLGTCQRTPAPPQRGLLALSAVLLHKPLPNPDPLCKPSSGGMGSSSEPRLSHRATGQPKGKGAERSRRSTHRPKEQRLSRKMSSCYQQSHCNPARGHSPGWGQTSIPRIDPRSKGEKSQHTENRENLTSRLRALSREG